MKKNIKNMLGTNKIITVLGPTATGKTRFAAHLAKSIHAEIISADSRQVYCGMNFGTGKDLTDYQIEDTKIPYHLIDIVDLYHEYSVYDFQRDFLKAYQKISSESKNVILCGGTGLYLDSVLKSYDLREVPKNDKLRKLFQKKSNQILIEKLKTYKDIHNISDTSDRNRLIRAIEIQDYMSKNPNIHPFPIFESLNFGIHYERESLKQRITQRLKERLEQGMIKEIKNLLDRGVQAKKLISFGLEYKFITQYVVGDLSFDEMFYKLNIAIHQFSKRQNTWFRRMEKQGIKIHWINGNIPMANKINIANDLINKANILNH